MLRVPQNIHGMLSQLSHLLIVAYKIRAAAIHLVVREPKVL